MNLLKDYFYYTKKERLAVLLLCSFISLFLLASGLLPLLMAPPVAASQHWESELMAFQAQQEEADLQKHSPYKKSYKAYPATSSYKKASFINNTPSEQVVLTPFPFDPNTVTAQALTNMGLPQKAIQSWMNYLAKGGYFKNKESVSKVYNLSPEAYAQLEAYIEFPEKEAPPSTALAPAFDFDPNTSSAEEFSQLGLSSKTIQSILNYRNKGGYFKKASDFKKIYTLPEELYQHLEQHIKIVEQPKKNSYAYKRIPSYQSIDINLASPADFEQFRGIGPSYARRLVEWRTRLGGFVNVAQVGELYQLPDSTFQQMRPFLQCAPRVPSKINVNTATLEELKNHPYLKWSQAKAIVEHREKKGPWKSVELLQILPELDDAKATFERIKPYLTI